MNIPKHTVLYKGMSISCKTVPKSIEYFFVTEDPDVAKLYAHKDLCVYRTTRVLRLFALTPANVYQLLMSSSAPLTFQEKQLIAMVTGVGVTKKNQAKYFEGLSAAMRQYLTDCTPGERFSHTNTNKLACVHLCKAFAQMGFDGYYAEPVNSVFHGGGFHREIMICNASDKLEIVRSMIPLMDRVKLKTDGVLHMFRLYAKRSNVFSSAFVEPTVTPVVAPGMAVKLYAERDHEQNKIIHDTLDLDISVFIDHEYLERLSPTDRMTVVPQIVFTVFERFDLICEQFVTLLNEEYDDLNVRLIKYCRPSTQTCLVDFTRTQGFPFLERNVFAVKQYYVGFPDTTVELMDVAVVYQPKKTPLDLSVSNEIGLPLPTLTALAEELWAMIQIDILGPSPLNQKRNPITGSAKQKGVKDLYRLKYVANRAGLKQYLGVVTHLINIVQKTNYSNATKIQRLRNVLSGKK
jgi:hypothetical protein